MFNGKNSSGKQFDVVNEENEVIGSFDTVGEAVACAKSAHWLNGVCNIRRDREITKSMHASTMQAKKLRMAAFYDCAA